MLLREVLPNIEREAHRQMDTETQSGEEESKNYYRKKLCEKNEMIKTAVTLSHHHIQIEITTDNLSICQMTKQKSRPSQLTLSTGILQKNQNFRKFF